MFKKLLPIFLVLLMLVSCGGYADFGDEPFYGDDEFYADTYAPIIEAAEAFTEPTADETEAASTTVPETAAETAPETSAEAAETTEALPDRLPKEGEYYYDLENVVLYLELYGELPPNYITKDEARELGWDGGSVEDYLEGAAIGGDRFSNREGDLPTAKGRKYNECDIDTDGYYSRGSRRLVYSNDGLYFYSRDHYETFDEVTVTDDYEVIW